MAIDFGLWADHKGQPTLLYTGVPLEADEFHTKFWGLNTTTPYTHNCVGGASVNSIRNHGKGWRTPTGRVHFAGSDTADEWQGYISGAIQSGHRAAAEVRRALGLAA